MRSLAAENDGLREVKNPSLTTTVLIFPISSSYIYFCLKQHVQEVESLQRACSALSRENGTLEVRTTNYFLRPNASTP